MQNSTTVGGTPVLDDFGHPIDSQARRSCRFRRKSSPSLALAVIALLASSVEGQVTELDCIDQIPNPVIVEFDAPGATVNDILLDYDVMAVPDRPLTTFAALVSGNPCAPLSGRAGSAAGFRLVPTGAWYYVGMSLVGTVLTEDREFIINAYDAAGGTLGSSTRTFSPGGTLPGYDDAVLFMGFSSTVPIACLEVLSDDPDVGWDFLVFSAICPTCGAAFTRGDCNGDGTRDLADAVFALAKLFVPGMGLPACPDAADANDDGVFDISDPVLMLSSLFVPGGPTIPEPVACGFDPTPDLLDCAAFAGCP